MEINHFQIIDKSKLARIKELYFALRIIFDSKDAIQHGKFYQISILYGQLRSLLTEKSKGITPLLIKISEILDENLQFYYLPDTFDEDLPDIAEKTSLKIWSLAPTIVKTFRKQEKIEMIDFLNKNIITYEKQSFKVKKIIEELANKYGGSHYSETTHKYLDELLNIRFNNQPTLDNLIVQVSDLCSDLGVKLLRKITDSEYYFNLYMTEKSDKGEIFILDYTLPNNSNRFTIILNQGKLHFILVDNIGYQTVLSMEQLIEYNKLNLINISIRLTPQFKTEIKIYINENLESEILIDDPQLYINDFTKYDCFYNRAAEGAVQDYELGLGEIILSGKTLNHKERSQMYQYFSRKRYDSILWFNKKSFGRKKSGNKKIELSGEVSRKNINKNA